MAEKSEEKKPPEAPLCGSGGSSWIGGWIQAAKDKSQSAYEFVKKDISEFRNTMQSDSGSIVCSISSKLTPETAAAATIKVKHGMSYLLDGIKTALIIPPDELIDNDAEPITISTADHIFDRAKARLHAIQVDPGTYCEDPAGPPEQFEKWKSGFDLDGKKGDISELLVSCVEVRALYTQMVPSSISHSDFWQRYFYKMHQLNEEDQRRADLMKRVNVKADDDLAWDDEDDWENMEHNSLTKSKASVRSAEPTATQETTESDPLTPDKAQTETNVNTDTFTEPSETETNVTGSDSTEVVPEQSVFVPESVVESSSPEGVLIDSTGTITAEDCAETPADSIKTKVKGDLVVVGSNDTSERTSPASSDNHSQNKESLDEDWEQDFDIEVTEEDVKAALEATKDVDLNEGDDWENWE